MQDFEVTEHRRTLQAPDAPRRKGAVVFPRQMTVLSHGNIPLGLDNHPLSQRVRGMFHFAMEFRFPVLWNQQRCSQVSPNTSRNTGQNPSAPSPKLRGRTPKKEIAIETTRSFTQKQRAPVDDIVPPSNLACRSSPQTGDRPGRIGVLSVMAGKEFGYFVNSFTSQQIYK